ncbi:ankyrin-1-like [Phymastichus coffea]|uniref:ankyrin-1-like n=1 Tax=Phymastichus coffea TaxID=108790 RepID=UPI00273BCC1E|nr:ankyrin-1-like [Phymastichus coffea]
MINLTNMYRLIYKSLLDDVRQSNVRSFRAIIEKCGLPQDDNWYDYDLLVMAVRLHRKRIVNYLLDCRCRVNKPFDDRVRTNTPLHLAAKKPGWCKVVVKMLRLKARVTDTNSEGNTPLHLAFINRLPKRVINMLLRFFTKYSRRNIVNRDGLGLVHIACVVSDRDCVEKFLNFGFDVGRAYTISCVSTLAQGYMSNYAGYSLLHFAVEAGNYSVAVLLCEYYADMYSQDYNGSTPFHLALEKRDIEMIDILCSYDMINDNCINDFAASHFMAACIGSNSNAVEKYLVRAEESPRTSIRRLLYGRVSDNPNYPDAGYSALHFASECGRVDTVFKLFVNGAHFTVTTDNLTPLDLARQHKHYDVCKLLEKHLSTCERCNNLTLTIDMLSAVGVGIKGIENERNILKNDTVFDFSRNRIFSFAKSFTFANFLWLCHNLFESC